MTLGDASATTPAARMSSRRRMSLRLLACLPADQHAADFAGAGADLVEFRVAQQAAGREVVDVAIAAQYLHRVQCHAGGGFGDVEDRAGGVLAGGPVAVAGTRDGIDIGAAGA